jgi:hypothetical protein
METAGAMLCFTILIFAALIYNGVVALIDSYNEWLKKRNSNKDE